MARLFNGMWWVVVAAMLWGAAAARGQEARPGGFWTEVPAEFADGLIYVKVKVGEAEGLWFLLDSGSPWTVIDASLARDLKLTISTSEESGPKAAYSYVSNFTVRVGADSETLPFAITKAVNELLSKWTGRQVSGVLGLDYIARRTLMIDYEHKHVYTAPYGLLRYSGSGTAIPVTVTSYIYTHILAAAPDGDLTGLVVIFDTGGHDFSIGLLPDWAKRMGVPRHGQRTITKPGATMNGVGQSTELALSQMQVGPYKVEHPVINITDTSKGTGASMLGTEFLEQFTVIFDLARTRVILEPNSAFGRTQRSGWTGLGVSKSPAGELRVEYLQPESPGARAGIQVGDQVLKVAGIAVADLQPGQASAIFDANIGQPVQLTILRAGQELELSLVPEDLVEYLRGKP